MNQHLLILTILFATVAMFLWGRWRHDMVAAAALLACVLLGLVPAWEAFSGFGHPAVITVACVLILSRGLQTSGAVDALTRIVLPAAAGTTVSVLALIGLGALLSGFMNNVGAMALLMPVAIQLSKRLDLEPGQILMPLAFGTILGGMTTLIGTPSNLIVSGFRRQAGTGDFAMFDFTPVGLAVAVAGIVCISLLGRRLVPARKQTAIENFEAGAYVTEARVPEDSKAVGMSVRDIEILLQKTDAQILGLVRNEVRLMAPSARRKVLGNDILIIEAEAEALPGLLSELGLKLEEAIPPADTVRKDPEPERNKSHEEPVEKAKGREPREKAVNQEDFILVELAVLPGSTLTGRSAGDIRLRSGYGLNLLAVSRQGQHTRARLRSLALQPGDLLLLQGPIDGISEFAADTGCVPLAERELRIPDKRKAVAATLIMAGAVGGAAFGLLPAAISFALGVLASMALRTVPPRVVYQAIDWPVIVLLGALMPVAAAVESTGAADLIARLMLDHLAQGHAVGALMLIMIITMFLSDLMNNAATAAVMCPIAIGTAAALGVSADSFLMAVAIGASCAFLTPIGHQNNTLILGPGGFRFSDYWRLGLLVEVIVVAVSIPLLLLVWPL